MFITKYSLKKTLPVLMPHTYSSHKLKQPVSIPYFNNVSIPGKPLEKLM